MQCADGYDAVRVIYEGYIRKTTNQTLLTIEHRSDNLLLLKKRAEND